MSTSPSTTEIVFALGAGELLVGRSEFCDEPPEAQRVETIGGFANPSVERIVSLTPTLVTGERGPAGVELVSRLESLGIAAYFPAIDRVADIERAIGELGQKLQREARGQEIAAQIRADIEAIELRTRARDRPKVVLLFDFKPLIAAGPQSFPDDLLRLAGGTNAVTSGAKYPTLGAEGLLALDPDVILDGSAGAYTDLPSALLRATPGLSELRAVRGGRVFRLEGTAALRPGPRIVRGLEQIEAMLFRAASP